MGDASNVSKTSPRASGRKKSTLIEITNSSGLRLQFVPGGGLFAVLHRSTLINQVLPCFVEDGLMRLVARLKMDSSRHVIPLAGLSADVASARTSRRSVAWKRESRGLNHRVSVVLHPAESTWAWKIRLRNTGKEPMRLDVIYGQDLGLADQAAVRNNEAFTSQYIDHYPVEIDGIGHVVLSRQNQAQSDRAHPWIAQGCLDGAVAYATDGYQFFGSAHRSIGIPEAWTAPRLPSRRLQYEFAYAGLQSPEIELRPGEERSIVFFAHYLADHPEASSGADRERVLGALADIHAWTSEASTATKWVRRSSTLFSEAPTITGEEPAEAECRAWFPGAWRHVERQAGRLFSFFHGSDNHVVTIAKESVADRPQGHILRSGTALWPELNILGTTVYATGVFNSQIYLGNTNFSRFLSVVRNPLNILRASGQRIFIRHGEQWRQLGAASVFEMGLRHARWIYRIGRQTIEIQTRCWESRSAISVDLRVLDGDPCAFLITHHLAFADEVKMGGKLRIDAQKGWLACVPAGDSMLGQHMPGTTFIIVVDHPGNAARLGGDELLGAGFRPPAPFAVVQTKAVASCTVTLAAGSNGEGALTDLAETIREEAGANPFSRETTRLPLANLRLSHTNDENVGRINEIIPWFAHDAMIHLAAPHGLEQNSGAAWGVRDVCQGPVEWLLAAGKFAEVRRILLTVFAQQYADKGDWPQWFMHPPFEFCQYAHSHGDIAFWPLKALCDYVEASNDFSIIEEEVPFTDRESFKPTKLRESLPRHVDRIVHHFEERRLAGTHLINYGDGDWDDTLQPADASLRSTMTSSWTVGLVYHAFRLWREVCSRSNQVQRAEKMDVLAKGIRNDFSRYLIVKNVVCGFAISGQHGFRPLLHPDDTVTNIRYRLLPMTRAILADLFEPDEASHHASLIRDYLLFPDGVRLMSDAVPYRGGLETIFKRAETAANFGREIGLQYVHAHLRYAEAMARLGDANALWRALQVVNPVDIEHTLPNAASRQSNAYFSSSDGDFADRYQACDQFEKLRQGTVRVKGGWRIYSSGPGLYLHKLVCSLLGWRESFGQIVIDPVLPRSLHGLSVELPRGEKTLQVSYRVVTGTHTPKTVRVNGMELTGLEVEPNRYRTGGIRLSISKFESALDRNVNFIEIEL